MSETEPSVRKRRSQPLIAVLSSVPMLREALAHTLEDIAEVRVFPAGRGDTPGLLRSLAPEAIIVDNEEEAEAAAAFAREADTPVVLVSYRDEHLLLLTDTGWEEGKDTISAEGIRNALVGGLFGRARKEAPTR